MNGVREYRRLESVQNANLHIGIKGVKAIPLTQGMFAIVDEEDYNRLNHFKWYAYKSGNTYYARRNIRTGTKKQTVIQMH